MKGDILEFSRTWCERSCGCQLFQSCFVFFACWESSCKSEVTWITFIEAFWDQSTFWILRIRLDRSSSSAVRFRVIFNKQVAHTHVQENRALLDIHFILFFFAFFLHFSFFLWFFWGTAWFFWAVFWLRIRVWFWFFVFFDLSVQIDQRFFIFFNGELKVLC